MTSRVSGGDSRATFCPEGAELSPLVKRFKSYWKRCEEGTTPQCSTAPSSSRMSPKVKIAIKRKADPGKSRNNPCPTSSQFKDTRSNSNSAHITPQSMRRLKMHATITETSLCGKTGDLVNGKT